MIYKPKHGARKEYKSILDAEGNLTLMDETFSSPSWAALAGIKDAGSPRKTVNGWTSWKTKDGKTIAMVRDSYIKIREK